MLKKTKKGYYVLEKFSQQEGLIHGFSVRKFGDLGAKNSLAMAKNKKIDRFLRIFGLEKRNLVLMEQVHGSKVKTVNENDKGKTISRIDGMVTNKPGLVLGVKTADCLPILFYDPQAGVVGIAHAGWKGVLKKIGQKVVEKMKLLGSKPKDILVGIGPHIGSCCYIVSKERVDRFEKEFGNLRGMIYEGGAGIHLDLTVPTIVQLIKVGILRKNIDFGFNCTSCQNNEFFSFRKDRKKTFGKMLGIIGLKERIHVHFMGVGGSGLAATSLIAKAYGFQVSGCDLSSSTYYTDALIREGIKPRLGHSTKHLQGVDILAVSPAVFDVSPDHPEVVEAKRCGILMTWQKFMGKYLQKDKFVVAVAGTHGKSTTTALMGSVLTTGGLDPTVEVGALVSEWKSNFRVGKSKYFVCEADEFNYNFLNYSPSIAIINNIEMDHPEFFKDFEEFLDSFKKFVQRLCGPKILIVNEENKGIQRLLREMSGWLKENKARVIGYFLGKQYDFPFQVEYEGRVVKTTPEFAHFRVITPIGEEEFRLKIPGVHNIANSLGVIASAVELGLDLRKVKKALAEFDGLGRRFDLVGQAKGVRVFDDYAVHPTAVKATLKAAEQRYPGRRVWAVFEPHQFSRLYLFLNEFASALSLADKVIVTKIYPGREKDLGKIKAEDLAKKIGEKGEYIKDFQEVAEKIAQRAKKNDLVIVFGAGKSYLLSRLIVEKLKWIPNIKKSLRD